MTVPMPRAVPFVGRERELSWLAARLEAGARLRTLLGPGGMGKTSLAVEHAARRAEGGDRTSVVFCDVSSAQDGAGVIDAMALACDAATGAGEVGIAHVAAALAARGEVVVVLDNVDRLAGAVAPLVMRWLAAAPEAEWVVTSRERLDIVGEEVLELGALDAGVALLVAAARRGTSGFELRAEDRASAEELVALLEGMPLAIEMAGARVPLLGTRGVLEKVRALAEGGAGVLERGVKGGPERHRSVDAAVRGSFESLDGEERDVLAQLAVFRGGFTVASAERVVVAGGGVAAVVERLRARSLVRTRDAGAARFDLYAAVRSFVERAHPAPIPAAAERHEAYFVSMAERAAEIAHRDARARAWLTDERDNVLAVATRVLGAGPVTARTAEPALRGIVALSPLLLARGPLASVAALVGPVVERTRDSGADPRSTARATMLRGAMLRDRGDVRGALKDLLGAEGIARALGDELLGADVRVELGRTLLGAGEAAAAREHFEKAARTFGSLGARAREAHALAWTAVGSAEEPALARAAVERAVALSAADPTSRAPYLALLGRACAELGDASAATRAFEEAIGVAAADHDARTEGAARLGLGLVEHEAGRLAQAAQQLASARDLFEVHGLEAEAANARGHLGMLALEGGRTAEAYALLADARDAAMNEGRGQERAYFEAQLPGMTAGLHLDVDGERGPGASLHVSAGAASSPRGRELLGSWGPGGADGWLARIARRVAGAGAAAASASALPEDALVVGEQGAWFRAPAQARVGLERRRSLALLLDRLVTERLAGGKTLTSSSLFGAAWPGEKAIASAAAHRVRVAVATLRKMGLRDLILTLPDGYLLSPDVRVVRV